MDCIKKGSFYMDKITAAETKRFYKDNELLKITSPAKGVIASTSDDFSIIPKVIAKGESTVLVMRHHSSAQVMTGEEIGLVVIPIADAVPTPTPDPTPTGTK